MGQSQDVGEESELQKRGERPLQIPELREDMLEFLIAQKLMKEE
jgi:hypothetical protein